MRKNLKKKWFYNVGIINLQTDENENIYIQNVQKLNKYTSSKSVNCDFIRAWHIRKTKNITTLIIDML